MTRDEIRQLSAKSGVALYGLGKPNEKFINHLAKFADLVASAEREACAKIVDENLRFENYLSEIIRARGQA